MSMFTSLDVPIGTLVARKSTLKQRAKNQEANHKRKISSPARRQKRPKTKDSAPATLNLEQLDRALNSPKARPRGSRALSTASTPLSSVPSSVLTTPPESLEPSPSISAQSSRAPSPGASTTSRHALPQKLSLQTDLAASKKPRYQSHGTSSSPPTTTTTPRSPAENPTVLQQLRAENQRPQEFDQAVNNLTNMFKKMHPEGTTYTPKVTGFKDPDLASLYRTPVRRPDVEPLTPRGGTPEPSHTATAHDQHTPSTDNNSRAKVTKFKPSNRGSLPYNTVPRPDVESLTPLGGTPEPMVPLDAHPAQRSLSPHATAPQRNHTSSRNNSLSRQSQSPKPRGRTPTAAAQENYSSLYAEPPHERNLSRGRSSTKNASPASPIRQSIEGLDNQSRLPSPAASVGARSSESQRRGSSVNTNDGFWNELYDNPPDDWSHNPEPPKLSRYTSVAKPHNREHYPVWGNDNINTPPKSPTPQPQVTTTWRDKTPDSDENYSAMAGISPEDGDPFFHLER